MKNDRAKRRIEVIPVWRPQVDRQLLVQALLSFVHQLADEAEQTATSEKEAPDA